MTYFKSLETIITSCPEGHLKFFSVGKTVELLGRTQDKKSCQSVRTADIEPLCGPGVRAVCISLLQSASDYA
jgi:hypothetical protein